MYQIDAEYLKRLGEQSLTSSLNSLSRASNQNVNISDRSLNYERSSIGSTIINLDRELSLPFNQHYQRFSFDRNPSTSDVSSLNVKSLNKEFNSSCSSKLRKNDLISDKSHQSCGSSSTSSAFDTLSPNELSLTKLDDNNSYSLSGSETIKRHYQSLFRKYESCKDELESLRKKYSDLVGTHGAVVSKLELSQDEHIRIRKSFEECCEQRNAAIHERSVLQSQCTSAIRQWDKALREINELKEQLSKVQHQRDDTIKEINVVMAQRIKSTKDLARLTDERNAAVQEYSLIMSERDSVHKEIEKLQEEQSAMQKRTKSLENDKKVMSEEIESLKREIASALFDRDRVLKVCNDLREKYSDYATGVNEDISSPTSPAKAAHNFWGSSSSGVSSWAQIMPKVLSNDVKSNHMSAASSNSSVSTFGQQQNKLCSNTRLDNLDQANLEIEMLRKQVERLQTDLIEAQQEVEVCKRRRDWAFNERDKIVLERESIRTLCDKLRRERDRAVSDLAEALRDSDDIKRQRNEASKELKELKEKFEAQIEKESRIKSQQQQQQQTPQFGTNNSSRDSAIDADMQEYEIETIELCLKRVSKILDWWGFKVSCDEKGVFINSVMKDGIADGKLKPNDSVVKINDILIKADIKVFNEALKKADCELKLVVQRRKPTRYIQTINYSVECGEEHGIVLENGFFVSKINAGSIAAKEGNLAVGDRVLYINGKSIDGSSAFDAMSLLNSSNIILQTMKNVNLSQNGHSNGINSNKNSNEVSDVKNCLNPKEHKQRKMVSCCSQTDDGIGLPPRPSVPVVYQSLSRSSGKRNSAAINSVNKPLSPSSFSNSSNSSSTGHDTVLPAAAPTLLDKAYNKIFGERKSSLKSKQQTADEDETKATIAELDNVIGEYSSKKPTSNGKYTKLGKYKKDKEKTSKDFTTWPKYRGEKQKPLIQEQYGHLNAVTTLHHPKRKQRKPLAIFSNNIYTKPGEYKLIMPVTSSSKIEPKLDSANDRSKDESITPSSLLSFEPASEAVLSDYHHHSKRNTTTHQLRNNVPPISSSASNNQKATPIYSSVTTSASSQSNAVSTVKNKSMDLRIYKPNSKMNSSLDYSVVSAQSRDKNLLEYYKNRAGVKQTRPHSIHNVLLTDNSSALNATNVQINGENTSYDSFNALHTSPSSPNVPIPPIRNSGAYAYYAINNTTHPQNNILHVHNTHYSNGSHITRGTPQPPIRHSSASPHSLLTPYISRSGDSLLSGNEHALHSHDLAHSRSVSAYHGGVHTRPYTFKDNLVNRYSITPSPSPSQYSGGLFGNQSPSHSMDIGAHSGANGAHYSSIHSKRLAAQHNAHQTTQLYHNNGVYRSEESNFPLSSIDGLSTFPKRNQRIRIPSNPSVTSKSSCGKLSTSSIDKASSSILSDRGSPISFQIEWSQNESSNCSDVSNANNRIAKPGDVRSIVIEKNSALSAPLGIQINSNRKEKGGIFVSQVSSNSLASQVGLLIGDQLLEVCGINMRNANYLLAANVLNNIRNADNITMLVHYNPDKYKEECVSVLKVEESEVEGDDEDDDEEGDDMDDEDDDTGDANDSASTSTPQSSPIEHNTAKPIVSRGNSNANEEENIPGSATSTLTRSKAASRSASNASRNTEKTITNSINERQSISSFKKQSTACEPRRIFIKKAPSSLGISLFGGNAVGIFVYSVRDEQLSSGTNGLKPGDQILEYNGVDLRSATAEEAAIELAKPSDSVSIVAQYNKERYIEIQSQQGDSFYIRAAFDRPSIDGSLAFRKDDILLVDNTMFNGVPGLWRAWLIDQEGQKVKCGVIPSKYKVEEELLMRRSLSEGSGDRTATSARRSFFRRRKNNHQRSSSRESTKELASFSDVSINISSESGALEALDQLLPPTYFRVERLSYETCRPVIIMGPLMEVLFEKLEQEFPHFFQRCIPEVMRGSQQMMERWLQDLKLVDYRRRGSHFECTTIAAVKEICDNDLHALLDVSPTSVERLLRCQIYPVVVFLKFKSAKQIKEIKDHRYTNEKLTTKAAKEMYENSLKFESEYKDLINIVIPGSNLTYMCTQVKTYVDDEQNKAHWVLS